MRKLKTYDNGGPKVKQRRGVRKNYGNQTWTPSGLQFPTSVSSHLMRTEYIPERGWVAFPSLFQDSKPYADDQQNWVDMSEEEDWMKVYKEAERRGEVYDFGEDKEAALAFGEGSWKDQLPDEGIEVELTDEEVEKYKAGGYILEELKHGGSHEEDPPDYDELMKAYKKALADKEAYDKQYALDLKAYKDKLPQYEKQLKKYKAASDRYKRNQEYIKYLKDDLGYDFFPSYDEVFQPKDKTDTKGRYYFKTPDVWMGPIEINTAIDDRRKNTNTIYTGIQITSGGKRAVDIPGKKLQWAEGVLEKDGSKKLILNPNYTKIPTLADPGFNPVGDDVDKFSEFYSKGSSDVPETITLLSKPRPIKGLQAPEYNPPVVPEKPKIPITKLDVIEPGLISNDAEISELIEGDFDNDYKAKRVVDKIKEYKVNKRGKLRKGPFGTKTTRSVRYEPIEEEQIYPEGFVPTFYNEGGYVLEEMTNGGDGGGTYTVKSGDTFYGIANRLGVSWSSLKAANPNINIDKLDLGQVLNVPEKKTVMKPVEKIVKPSGMSYFLKKLKSVANKPVYDDYFNSLMFQENSIKKGWNPETQLWMPAKAPEKGGGFDIGYGHKIQKGEDFSKGITNEEAIALMKKDFKEKRKNASKYINETYGKGTFESLPVSKQVLLTDYEYNVAGGIGKFKNFARGVIKDDKDLMLKEYVRYSGGKPLGERNKFTEDWINKYFKDTPKEQDGGFIEIDLSEEDALSYAQNGYIVEEVQNYNRGGTVSSIWKERTGTPWSEAKAQGLTDGSYDQNIALRKRLLQGEFDSETFKSTPAKEREEKKSFDYERYDKRIRDRVAKGQTLDDLVKRRLGTRQGLTARFPDLFGEKQNIEVADLTDEQAEELTNQGYTLEETDDTEDITVDFTSPFSQFKTNLASDTDLKSFSDMYDESTKYKGLSFDLDSDKVVGSIQPIFKMNLPDYKRPSYYDPNKSFSENYKEFTKYKGLTFDLRSDREKQIIKDARQKVEDEINALKEKEKEESRSADIKNVVSKDKYGPELMAMLNRVNQTTQEETAPVYVDPITGRNTRDRSVQKLVSTPIIDNIAEGFVGAANVAGEYIDAATGLPKKIYKGVSKEIGDVVDKIQKTSILPGYIKDDAEELYNFGSSIVNKDYEALLKNEYGQKLALRILDQNVNPNKYMGLRFKTLSDEEQQYLKRGLEKEGLINTPDEVLKPVEEKVIKETPKPEAFVQRIGDVKDSYDRKYKLLSYRNQWDNNEGFVYRTAPTKQHRKNSDTYKDVIGVAHFLLDASVDPKNPYSHRNNKSYIRRAKANNEWIPAFENVSDNEVRLKYKKPEDILETDIVSAPLRQLKFSDINFKSSQTPRGFKSTVNEVTTTDGRGTYLLFKSRNGYSRFSGGSVVFIFKDKYDNTIVRDFAGSLNSIQKEGESIQKQYELEPGELTIGYHDVGSFSAKPKADDNNVLRADQWKGYNNNGYTGGALLIPSKR